MADSRDDFVKNLTSDSSTGKPVAGTTVTSDHNGKRRVSLEALSAARRNELGIEDYDDGDDSLDLNSDNDPYWERGRERESKSLEM